MPKGLRILHLSLGERNLTHFGGIFLIHQFCKKLRLKWYLQKQVPFPQRSSYYHPVELYGTEGAKTLLLTMGSFGETAKIAIDAKTDKGESVGLINLRIWRPFPCEELHQTVKDAETLIVFDRCVSFGGPGGPVSSEIRSALYDEKERPKVVSFVGGLGGRDMSVKDFEYVIDRGREIAEKGSKELFETVGIRGKVTGIRG